VQARRGRRPQGNPPGARQAGTDRDRTGFQVVLALQPWTGRLKTLMLTLGVASGVITQKIARAGVMPQVRIGVISDTHGLLRPEAEQHLAGVAHIVHAGDIGHPDVITRLRQIAPVTAIRGNVDTGHWAEQYPDTEIVKLGGRTIHILHDVHELKLDPLSSGIDVVISGHSHRPRTETVDGVLYLNPGSAGPRRFNLPITLATLELNERGLRPTIHHLRSQSGP
jgi:putative phosphoesterase